jgi:hypothetical protein
MIPATRVYADPGDRTSGRYNPPRLCRVLTQWGPVRPEDPVCVWLRPASSAGPRNVAVEYGDGSRTVIPFSRRLRRVIPGRKAAATRRSDQ